ncbi:MAG: hypothetical protein AAFV29_21950 [Myxococcota bacterium]
MHAFERAELAKGLIDHIQDASWRGRLLPVAVAILCGTVATVLAVYRIPSANLNAQIRSTSAAFSPASTFEWKGNISVGSDELRFDKYAAALEAPQTDEPPGVEGRGSLGLAKGRAALKSLSAASGGQVTFELDASGQLQIFTNRSRASAQLLFWGKVQVDLQSDGHAQSEPFDVEVPETLYLDRVDKGVLPSVLQFTPKQSFELPLIEVSEVSFSREVLENNEATFRSSILEADLTIVDTDEEVSVGPNQSLTLVGFTGQIRRMSVGDEIQLSLTGKAEDIIVASGDVQRSLVPTYLSFMYQNQQIALVWSGVMFLWGMLWSVGRFIIRRS